MSKTSSKQKLETLQSWISWITFQSKKKNTKKTLSRQTGSQVVDVVDTMRRTQPSPDLRGYTG